MKLLIFLLALGMVSCQIDYEKQFRDFFLRFEKIIFDPIKLILSRINLKKVIDRVQANNKAFLDGLVSYEMTLYDFSDENPAVLVSQMCGTELPITARALLQVTIPSFPTGPATMDWRPYLLPVIDQGRCGSCWSFSAIAQVESLYKRKNLAFNTPLSAQYLVDCSRNGNNGCNGGWPKTALDYLKANGVIAASNYGYKEVQSSCKRATKMTNIISSSIQYDLKGDETLLKNILARDGPIVVAIVAKNNFMNYKGGVYEDSSCSSSCSAVNHGVLLVGYGKDAATGKDFWLIRNSWGASWGEKGYIRMARNRKNNCLTACYAMYTK